MADTFEPAAREPGGAKSTILRLIRPSANTSNPETAALRAEIEGFRLALSIAQDALREERCDKEHWRDEAKCLRQLLAGHEMKPAIINVPEPKAGPRPSWRSRLPPPSSPSRRTARTPKWLQQIIRHHQHLTGGGGGYSPERVMCRRLDYIPDGDADVLVVLTSVLKAPAAQPATVDRPWNVWASGYGDPNGVGSHDTSVRDYGYATGLDYRIAPDVFLETVCRSICPADSEPTEFRCPTSSPVGL